MKIIKANITDKDFIVNSQINMALESENLKLTFKTVNKGVEYILNNPSVGFYLLSKIKNRPTACLLVLKEWSDWRCGNVLWIHSVYVVKENRRQGIYSKMYGYLKDLVNEDESLRGLRLYVDKSNKPAINTYEKLGMSQDHYYMYEWMKTF